MGRGLLADAGGGLRAWPTIRDGHGDAIRAGRLDLRSLSIGLAGWHRGRAHRRGRVGAGRAASAAHAGPRSGVCGASGRRLLRCSRCAEPPGTAARQRSGARGRDGVGAGGLDGTARVRAVGGRLRALGADRRTAAMPRFRCARHRPRTAASVHTCPSRSIGPDAPHRPVPLDGGRVCASASGVRSIRRHADAVARGREARAGWPGDAARG